MLLLHILVALSGLLVASYNALRPHKQAFLANYIFLAATIGSGTFLVIQSGAHMLAACASGLGYTAAMLVLHQVGRARLAKQPITND